MDGEEYLEPGFDATILTVPRLRSILLAHGVNYPSSAKKSALVELFDQSVASQARQIKSASLRVKRSSRGIVDVPSSASSLQDEEEEQEPPATLTRSSRRSTRARTEEAEEVQPTPRRARHSTAPPEATPRGARSTGRQRQEAVVEEEDEAPAPRRSVGRPSSKHGRQQLQPDEMEDEEPKPKRPASRQSRISAVTPGVKREERDDRSPFSDHNVFQSGSSPPPPQTAERRRTTTTTYATSDEAKRRRSRDARRRTEEVRPARQQLDGAVVPTRKTFEVPISRFKREEVEADEEFTPDEQLDLVQAEQAGAVIPARRKTQPTARAPPGLLAVLIAVLAAVSGLWANEKFEVGYCDVGHQSLRIGGVEVPEWLDGARPACEKCPQHAICYERLETQCEADFVLTHHPLSLGGYLPIPPTCEPDSVKARKVKAVKERAVEKLREQNALHECGDASSPAMKESELKAAISSQKRRTMSNEEFENMWDSALGDIRDEQEIIVSEGG